MRWEAVYGLAALLVAAFSRTAPKRDVRVFSLLLLLYWLIFNAIGRGAAPLPDAVQLSAAMDAIGMSVALNACLNRYRRWKAALVLCFAGQLVTHIAVMFVLDNPATEYQYRQVLNLLFGGELACVSAPTIAFHLRRAVGSPRRGAVAPRPKRLSLN